jgi:glycosyltransferase domain-containing protein
MEYMNDLSCPYKILIADGGKDKEVENKLLDKNNYANLDYTYIRYPYDHSLSDFYKKFISVINLVKTPYLLFADNDDFFLLDKIPQFINFLNQNADYTACGGSNVHLSLLTSNNLIVNSTSAENYIATCTDINRSVENNTGIGRIEHFMKFADMHDLWSCWYQIQRTTSIVKAFDFLNRYHFRDLVAYEIHIHLQLLIIGKYKELKNPFYVRQAGTSQMTSSANIGTNLVERFIKNNAFDELHKSINSIIPELLIDEKERIYSAFASWFIHHGSEIYRADAEIKLRVLIKQSLMLITSHLRSFLWPLRIYYHAFKRNFKIKSGSKNGSYQSMKLIEIEKFILNR